MKFKFAVGIARSRTVTVRAESKREAELKARETLDQRAEKQGREPPVAWDLVLLEIVGEPSMSTETAESVLRDVKRWAESRCPCSNDQPKICPLCGADVDNPDDGCKAAPETFPPALIERINKVLGHPS